MSISLSSLIDRVRKLMRCSYFLLPATRVRPIMKMIAVMVVFCCVALTTVVTADRGRTLSDQEVWNVRGAYGDGWCALKDIGCNASAEAVTCSSVYDPAVCPTKFTEVGNWGNDNWWTCGTTEIPNMTCSISGTSSYCRFRFPCQYMSWPGGPSWYGFCVTSTSWSSAFNSYQRSQVTGTDCP